LREAPIRELSATPLMRTAAPAAPSARDIAPVEPSAPPEGEKMPDTTVSVEVYDFPVETACWGGG